MTVEHGADVIGRFLKSRDRFEAAFPTEWAEAERLSKGLADPGSASADEVWKHIWSKPLYSNTKVQIGDASVAKLLPYVDNAWRDWGLFDGQFRIEKVGKGTAVASFRPCTNLATHIRNETGIALHRLYAIQGAAAALRKRNERMQYPYSDLVQSDLRANVARIEDEMGAGWGAITVLHFLTDIGLACKPDLHLVRSVRRLGIVSGLSDRVPTFAESMAINEAVRRLIEQAYGACTPSSLRIADKLLMEMSRKHDKGEFTYAA